MQPLSKRMVGMLAGVRDSGQEYLQLYGVMGIEFRGIFPGMDMVYESRRRFSVDDCKPGQVAWLTSKGSV